MSTELTSVILLGLGCAANPWGIMVAVLLLNARRGLWVVWTYVAAWIIAISGVMALLLLGFGSTDSSSNSTNTTVAIAELIIGLALLAFGARSLLKTRRERAMPQADRVEKKQPGWLRAIEEMSVIGALLLGFYSATYPLVVAAAGEILRADVSASDELALAIIFVILGSSTVVAVAALGTFAPSRSEAFLARMREWLTVHNSEVLAAILLLFGLALTARGIQSL
ncbi:MAG: GAP family protein [Thermoleophilia bacterium]